MKPRWKILAEIAASLAFMVSGAWGITDALNGGATWHWLGAFSLVYGIRLAQTNWKAL